jgi:hypothetical protein
MPTTTPLNGWPVPVSTDLVKDGAVAIESLGDAIDTSVGEGLKAWKSWAPALGTGWSNGNGVWSNAFYCQIGKTVHVRATFTMGTSRPGTLTGMSCSLPVPPTGSAFGFSTNRAGGSSGQFMFQQLVGSQIDIYAINSAGTYLTRTGVTSSIPGAWTTSDFIAFAFTYEAA